MKLLALGGRQVKLLQQPEDTPPEKSLKLQALKEGGRFGATEPVKGSKGIWAEF